eukprot:3655403-Alexandrium_andersonii.AAC.1
MSRACVSASPVSHPVMPGLRAMPGHGAALQFFEVVLTVLRSAFTLAKCHVLRAGRLCMVVACRSQGVDSEMGFDAACGLRSNVFSWHGSTFSEGPVGWVTGLSSVTGLSPMWPHSAPCTESALARSAPFSKLQLGIAHWAVSGCFPRVDIGFRLAGYHAGVPPLRCPPGGASSPCRATSFRQAVAHVLELLLSQPMLDIFPGKVA